MSAVAKNDTEPMDRLKDISHELLGTLGGRAADALSHSMEGLTERLGDVAEGGPLSGLVKGAAGSASEGKSPVGGALKGAMSGIKDKVTGGGGGGKGDGGKPTKATKIIEEIDVGVPVSVAYNQWTEFNDFPQFMRKVEKAEAEEETKISWKAQIFWSHRSWEATIQDQIPDERIVWRSKGQKGHVDGAVTFHELGPNLTRIIVVLEYYPQGLFERTGNIWRAQGRRVRAELQQFRRHVMTRTILNPDDVEGWRGEIHDGEVVRSHDEVVQDEQDSDADEQSDEPEDEGDYDDAEGAADEDYEDEPEDEPEDAEADEEPEPDDDYEEPEDEQADDEPADDEPADDEDDSREPEEPDEDEVDEAPRRRSRRR